MTARFPVPETADLTSTAAMTAADQIRAGYRSGRFHGFLMGVFFMLAIGLAVNAYVLWAATLRFG